MDLSNSKDLIRTPDFSLAKKLERLNLARCTSLLEVDPSISAVDNLVHLNLDGCSSLEKFPSISGNMKKLESLYLNSTAITGIPSSINDLPALTFLTLRNCRELISLPSSIHMESLRILNLDGCSKLEKFPEISGVMKHLYDLELNDTAIRELPSSINHLTGLVHLSMRNCTSLVRLPEEIRNLICLEIIYLDGCSKLEKLPENFPHSMSERDGDGDRSPPNLDLEESGIQQLPFGILRILKVSCIGCKELRAPFSSWPTWNHQTSSDSVLDELDLSGCNLLELSDAIAHLSSLRILNLDENDQLESLPAAMNRLRCLKMLGLDGCKKLKSIPELSPSIQFLFANNCTSLETVSTPQLPYAQALCFFQFFNCSKLVKTNLFTDIAKSVIDNQESLEANKYHHDFNYHCMYLPGSDIPDWFDHQSIGSSVTVQLPPDGFANEVQGFAICAISNLRSARSLFLEEVSCCATFETTVGQKSFYLDLYPEALFFERGTPLESDHMLLGCFHSSGSGKFEGVSECTEATFTIVSQGFLNNPLITSITSCGVRLFHTNAPSSLDIRNLENRETEIERNKRKRETQERGKEKMGVEAQEEAFKKCSGGPICYCLSSAGCTTSVRKQQREGEREVEEADVSGVGDSFLSL